jgi:hypothetical protein
MRNQPFAEPERGIPGETAGDALQKMMRKTVDQHQHRHKAQHPQTSEQDREKSHALFVKGQTALSQQGSMGSHLPRNATAFARTETDFSERPVFCSERCIFQDSVKPLPQKIVSS